MTTQSSLLPPPASILVVDDTVENLKLLSDILTNAGYHVRPMERPLLALESALAHPPALILLDVRMPEMNGFELCHRLKQDERTRDIPVVFMSALQDGEDSVQGYGVGGVDFVSKPFQEPEVLARVKTHLQLHVMQFHFEELVAERTVDLTAANKALQLEIAQHKLTEAALLESEHLRKKVEKVAGIGHYNGDMRTGKGVWSDELYRIYGYSPGEIEMTHDFVYSHIHPDDREKWEKANKDFRTGKRPYDLEYRILQKDGEIKIVRSWATLTVDESGEPKRSLGLLQDITDRKQVEEALRESELRFRATFEQAAVGIAHVAPNGRFLDVNQKFCDIVGYTEAEILALDFQNITHPDDLYADLQKVRALLEKEAETYTFEKRYIHKLGHIVWINLTVSLLWEESGEPKWFVSVIEDITARKQMEENLRESEANFRAVIDQSPVSIQIHGLDGKLLQSNPAYAKLYALNEETLMQLYERYNVRTDAQAEAIGVAPFVERVYAGENVRFPAYEYDGIDTLKTLDFENPVSRTCWIETLGFPLKDEKGNFKSVVFMSEDITERKRAEQAVDAYQQRLQALAAELTLAEERERRRIAADLHDHVSQSLALARIQLGTARKVDSQPRRDKMLDEVSQTLLEAIQDTRTLIFDLSSPLLNELGLKTAVSAWLRDQIGRPYNLKINFQDDSQEKPLAKDVRAILFRNVRELLANVVRHAQATTIEVSLTRRDATIQIIIQDDGIGFDPQTTTQKVHPRGGFGLFSIQERMTDLGGSLQIDSAQNQGCTVVLTAPLLLSE